MIPKIIHYCWFGGQEIPEEYAGYITEWQQLHPDWEFICWNESNSPIENPYLRNAVALHNWANCSNFVRLWVLKQFGGIYLDTDVKLLQPLDSFLKNTCFLGFESGTENSEAFFVNNAVMGSIAGGNLVRLCLEKIISDFDGSEEAYLSSPRLITNVLVENYKLQRYGTQQLQEVQLFTKEVFYPLPYQKVYDKKNFAKYVSPETAGIHMWGRTWLSKEALLKAVDELQSWSHDLTVHIEDLKAEIHYLKAKL